ncbi:hypothetical protein ACRALDRAFT_1074926 [Sodiomyces alcalophilus JCM 7366]|uniref:uncharacterized protein n=1 Tax=Sodiomyces alcalophilus JCM 7366 TaxID=591952 RepID=UPI0039B6AC99
MSATEHTHASTPPVKRTPTTVADALPPTQAAQSETKADNKHSKPPMTEAKPARDQGSDTKIPQDPPTAQSDGTQSPTTSTTQGADNTTRATSIEVDTSRPQDFAGAIATTNELPTQETLRKLDDYVVLDRDGRSHTFKSLYSGRNVARRMLIIFVRHFLCGNCQEYLRTLSESVTTDALLGLPVSTFITIIGCGDPAMIQAYAEATNCRFPIYTDPKRYLYRVLGMTRTWELGEKPAYIKRSFAGLVTSSIFQGLKQLPSGLATKSGDSKQVGGEFLFEPTDLATPIATPEPDTIGRSLDEAIARQQQRKSGSVHEDEDEGLYGTEEKHITWCHRMKTTRDHAEISELMEVLGLNGNVDGNVDSNDKPVRDERRWSKALGERKGTGLSLASQMSRLSDRRRSRDRSV